MTCAKATVECVIFDRVGHVIGRGKNACANPQAVCPREPGEGYEKCTTICQQGGHAEVQALANMRARELEPQAGSLALVRGHTYACRECQEALYAAGVGAISVLPGRAAR